MICAFLAILLRSNEPSNLQYPLFVPRGNVYKVDEYEGQPVVLADRYYRFEGESWKARGPSGKRILCYTKSRLPVYYRPDNQEYSYQIPGTIAIGETIVRITKGYVIPASQVIGTNLVLSGPEMTTVVNTRDGSIQEITQLYKFPDVQYEVQVFQVTSDGTLVGGYETSRYSRVPFIIVQGSLKLLPVWRDGGSAIATQKNGKTIVGFGTHGPGSLIGNVQRFDPSNVRPLLWQANGKFAELPIKLDKRVPMSGFALTLNKTGTIGGYLDFGRHDQPIETRIFDPLNYCAVLWIKGKLIDLNKLYPIKGYKLTKTWKVMDDGRIVAEVRNKETRAMSICILGSARS